MSSFFWAIVIGIIIWIQAMLYIRKQMPGESVGKCCLAGLIATVVTVISILLHELAHAGAASFFGIATLNMGFGPFYAYVELEESILEAAPIPAIFISLAGPAMNLLIGALGAIIVKLYEESIPENTVQFIAYINIRLSRWNLIPFIAFDGGKALYSLFRLVCGDPTISHYLVIVALAIYIVYWIFFRDNEEEIEDKLEEL